MDRKLIIKALESACGNRNFQFQLVLQDSCLHICVNRKADYQPDYSLLEKNAAAAIAALSLDSVKNIYLYSRKSGEAKSDWQTSINLSTEIDSADLPTEINLDQLPTRIDLDYIPTEIDLDHIPTEIDLDYVPTGIDFEIGDTIANIGITENSTYFTDFEEVNSTGIGTGTGDTGLLYDTGLIHGTPFKEDKIKTFFTDPIATESNDSDTSSSSLAQYCFIADKRLLTSNTISPHRKTIRLVRFFHHLSDNDQHRLLPALDNYFQYNKVPNLKSSKAIQKWLEQIIALNDRERYTFAIWLSRYCFDSCATLEKFKAVVAQNDAVINVRKAQGSKPKYRFTPANTSTAKSAIQDFQLNELPEEKPQLFSVVQEFIVPFVWTVGTVILLILGINSNSNLQAISPLCNNTIGSAAYCGLTVNLAGEKAIQTSSPSVFPLTEITETVATYGCERYANFKAGFSPKIDPKQTPVISSYGERVFPHIYVVEVLQKYANQTKNLKVGCVYTAGLGKRSPKLLAARVIPQNWAITGSLEQPESKYGLSFGIYTNSINLGLHTIFAAIGVASSSLLNLGIKIQRSQTIYLVALILGIVQLIAGNLVLGLVSTMVLLIVTILGVSLLFKDFQIDWNRNISFVSISVLVIIAVQFLFYGLCLELIKNLA
ncbi:hypothetical protein IQ255_26480 [Pleurocapsales cyanobacterium LEGE 10410]|nr:hypothetical protein [Pleurocapsales cyanobacterium LEGE 10410]